MKILIVGAGAIGCYMGAYLGHKGHTVTFVTRPKHVYRMRDEGIVLRESAENGQERQIHTYPHVFGSVRAAVGQEPNPYQLVIIATKSYDVEPILDELAEFYHNVPMVMSLQNGIGVEDLYIARFSAERVLAGSITVPVSIDDDGSFLVEVGGSNGVAIAPALIGKNVVYWHGLFQDAGINTSMIKSYEAMKWSKALSNIAGNASSAILNWNPNKIYRHDQLYEMELGMLHETLAVMKAMNLRVENLPGLEVRKLPHSLRFLPARVVRRLLIKEVSRKRGGKMPSFNLDLLNGKPNSEVTFHNKAIAQAGQQYNVPTPINLALATTLLKLVSREEDWLRFQDQPLQLLKVVDEFKQAQTGQGNIVGTGRLGS